MITNQKYAGLGVRLIAALVDAVLLALVNSGISYTLQLTLGDNSFITGSILGWIISVGYYIVYQAKYTQTIGKKVMNIKVITYDGKTPSMSTFFIREILGKIASAVILLIGYLMVLWDPKKQALHDKIADTYVVYVS
jgi:uncharacterized RDD family membrane protein YckC